MAPSRTSWKGFLRLSLVSVPVKAYTAHNTSETIRLNQLHADCNSRIKYQKVCPEHGELKQKDIVSGYEYTKDQYVVIDTAEIAKLRKESDKSVHIRGFVQEDTIDPVYSAGKSYYLLPDGVAGNKPYSLLACGMREDGVVAVGQVVMSGRDQLVVLRPVDDLLVMQVLHYAKQVKPMDAFHGELVGQEVTQDELDLTRTLIQASTQKEFDFEKLTDPYADQLGQLIQMKIDGEEIVQAPDPEEPKILNLMDALKASVAAAQAGQAEQTKATKSSKKKATKKKASERKMAPSAKASKKKAARRKSG